MWVGGQGVQEGPLPHPLPVQVTSPHGELDCAPSFPWLSSHLRYPPFSSHVISFLASFAAFCPTQSQLQREEGAVGVGSWRFFLPWLLKPGLQPPSWDTLQVMQGLGAGCDPPGLDVGPGRGTQLGSQLQWGWRWRSRCITQPWVIFWEPTGACCDPAPQLDAAPEPCTLGGDLGAGSRCCDGDEGFPCSHWCFKWFYSGETPSACASGSWWGMSCPGSVGRPSGSGNWTRWEHVVVPEAWQGQGWWPGRQWLDDRGLGGGKRHQSPDPGLSLLQGWEPVSAPSRGWECQGWCHRARGCRGVPGGRLGCLHLCCFQPCQET